MNWPDWLLVAVAIGVLFLGIVVDRIEREIGEIKSKLDEIVDSIENLQRGDDEEDGEERG